MNNTLFFLRYIITGYLACKAGVSEGVVAGAIVFTIANVLWTLGEEAILNQSNRRKTAAWKSKNER